VVACQVVGGLPAHGVPDDGEAEADQPERDGALDRAAGAVAGLADAGELAGLFEADLDAPSGGVACDQLGGGCVQVGGGQRQVVAVGRAGWADLTGPRLVVQLL
jgi:hypothetical protein